jgi:transcriptional activator of eps genes
MEGNPAAALWFCDVKSHGEAVSLASPLPPVSAPIAWDADFRVRHRDILPRLVTQQKVARIVAAARNARPDLGGCDSKQYFDRHLYGPSGWEFKLSLFPLPVGEIGTRSWARAHQNQPALIPQGRYFALCREGKRFKFVADLRKRMQPKVIVCLGTRNSDDFLRAFGFTGATETKHVLQPADLGKPISVYSEGSSTLLICPPLAGASGLNSDVLQEALGKYIAQFM